MRIYCYTAGSRNGVDADDNRAYAQRPKKILPFRVNIDRIIEFASNMPEWGAFTFGMTCAKKENRQRLPAASNPRGSHAVPAPNHPISRQFHPSDLEKLKKYIWPGGAMNKSAPRGAASPKGFLQP